ncbi:regulator of G-protein signaling 7-like [Tubulanus polymorphus]|uniref:regulator of G-protein signaling 7-like n=1 Tax=Tubulanus polymorphus TaxID=672921 RepID=UPI003DA45077
MKMTIGRKAMEAGYSNHYCVPNSSNEMVFSKIENIVQGMQNPINGVLVRCQKIFLTTIPSAFTGYDLVEWLIEKMQMLDSTEAVHMANLFCQYGYIFPVTESRNIFVKDDNSLYRFQSPYFWPSKNCNPDDIEYAIYLTKRTLRNKQRHGLDDYEQLALTKLQNDHCDKLEFIHTQAEEQVRLVKEKKKSDKVIIDSQERAFWRMHRPTPGQVKRFEENVMSGFERNYPPRRKKTLQAARAEYQYLKLRLELPRMKVSKALESLTQRCELYAEHDPFICGSLPSNPWISDDTTMWLVDTPTERRVKRWMFGLNELLADATGRHEFESYLKKEYSQENIRFWFACEEMKYGPQSNVADRVQEIFREFLAPGAPCEINIDGKTMEQTQANMANPNRYTFDAAQAHVFALMKRDSYQRFLRSDHYKNLLANALQPFLKKK